jgi:NitT/TauT family transport system ATP-binding protein
MSEGIVFTNTDLPDIIEFRNVTQKYGEKVVLDELNLLIENKPDQGQFVVLMGESGSGKSTLLRYLNRLQKPTSGEILVHGKPIEEAGAISTVFQDYSSFPWYTVLENVELPLRIQGVSRKERREKAMDLIAKVGLSGHEQKYARAPLLSGGQLQRVAIARSLITNPEIILMDEPFGALDGITRYEMQMLLLSLWKSVQSTIIFITHDYQEGIFLGDDVYVLDPRIGKIGTHIPVDLPFDRSMTTKHEPRFSQLVLQLEESLIATAHPLTK